MNRSTFIALLVLASLGLAACTGLDIGDFLSVPTPVSVQQETGLPGKLTLNRATDEYQLWHEQTMAAARQWKGNIERADHFRGVFNQFTLGVLEGVGPTIAGIPALAPIAPLLAGLGGLLLKRPGDVTKDDLRKQKEASYNAGLEAGRKLSEKVIG